MSVPVPTSAHHDELVDAFIVLHPGERRIKLIGLVAAVLIHALLLAVPLPRLDRTVRLSEESNLITVRKYLPPPPRLERPQSSVVRPPRKRMLPVPDPTPDELEPIREPVPDYYEDDARPQVDLLIGEPEPPPEPEPLAPLLSGAAGVSDPRLIESSQVKPVYPDIARRAKLQGSVVLQAIIHPDGTVGDLHVVHCDYPNVGFERAALEAVARWRYEPGTYRGKRVAVVLTVKVHFQLLGTKR